MCYVFQNKIYLLAAYIFGQLFHENFIQRSTERMVERVLCFHFFAFMARNYHMASFPSSAVTSQKYPCYRLNNSHAEKLFTVTRAAKEYCYRDLFSLENIEFRYKRSVVSV